MAEFVEGALNRDRLRKLFDERDVDPRSYDFEGSNLGEQYVLELGPGGWSVYYAERGQKNDQRFFDTEDAACHELMSRVLKDPTTRRRR